MAIPTLRTERLLLRGFSAADAPVVQRLAGSKEVASTTLNIPHPYSDGVAEAWIERHEAEWTARTNLALAVTTAGDGVIGCMSLKLDVDNLRGELGYWIGVPFWNLGYATEAARALVGFGFDEIGLNRIEAQYLTRNPASARVMEKLGMKLEGTRRQHIVKWGVPEDIGFYAILSADR